MKKRLGIFVILLGLMSLLWTSPAIAESATPMSATTYWSIPATVNTTGYDYYGKLYGDGTYDGTYTTYNLYRMTLSSNYPGTITAYFKIRVNSTTVDPVLTGSDTFLAKDGTSVSMPICLKLSGYVPLYVTYSVTTGVQSATWVLPG